MDVKNVISKEDLLKTGIGLGKDLIFFLLSNLLTAKKGESNDNSGKKSKLRLTLSFTKKILLALLLKEIIYGRIKAKLELKPNSGDFSWLLDTPFREQLVDLRSYIQQIKKKATVLDLGSGSGYFAIEVSKQLNEEGKVICVDCDLDGLKELQKNASEENITNIDFHRANIEKLPFETESADYIFLNMTFGQLPDKITALKEIYRVLKKDGQLYITEILIDNYYCLRSTVLGYASSTGFKAVAEKGNLLNYTLILKK